MLTLHMKIAFFSQLASIFFLFFLLGSNKFLYNLSPNRMEKLAFRTSSTQAKIIGTVVLILGAFVVTLYKGPAIITTQSPAISLKQSLSSLQSNWAIGGLLLSADYLLISVWYIVQVLLHCFIYFLKLLRTHQDFKHTHLKNQNSEFLQAQTVKKYPAEFLIVFLYNLLVTIVSAPVCFFIEPNLSAWKIKDGAAWVSILYTVSA